MLLWDAVVIYKSIFDIRATFCTCFSLYSSRTVRRWQWQQLQCRLR